MLGLSQGEIALACAAQAVWLLLLWLATGGWWGRG